MELTPRQQITDLIKKSKRILVLTHRNPEGDSLGAEIALLLALKKLGKKVTAVAEGEIPSSYNFLKTLNELQHHLDHSRDFIVSVDIREVPVDKLGYKIEGDKLNIVITPAHGNFTPEMVNFSQSGNPFDLILAVDTPDIDQIGELYDENAQLFFEIPVVNIDHHVANEYFGKVNLVDITATSTCEIVLSILESLESEQKILDEEIATALLLGIITDTGSFRNPNTTPKSLTVAAQLVAAGARQQEIIKNIYKTKPLSTLRLWGRILASIREDKKYRIVWSLVAVRDLEQCGASEEDVTGAIDELLSSAPNADIILLLAERETEVFGSIRTSKEVDAAEVAKLFGGGGHKTSAGFKLKVQGLAEAERTALEKLRQYQERRLSLQTLKE